MATFNPDYEMRKLVNSWHFESPELRVFINSSMGEKLNLQQLDDLLKAIEEDERNIVESKKATIVRGYIPKIEESKGMSSADREAYFHLTPAGFAMREAVIAGTLSLDDFSQRSVNPNHERDE